jgi:hypothetical protein
LESFAQVDESEATNWERRVATTHAAADIIRHTHSTHSGIVKAIIRQLMKAHSIQKGVVGILNELGVSDSYRTVRLVQYIKFAEKIAEGSPEKKLKRFIHLSTLFDNRGYRRGGSAARVGYDQFLFHLVEQLQSFVECIIYPSMSVAPDERKTLLSRVEKDCEEERKTAGCTEVLAPALEDFERLAECVFGIIEELLNTLSAGHPVRS